MSVKTAGVGHFAIPTAPAAGTSCTSGAANVFTTTYVQLIASTAAALYITGIFVESATALGGTYDVVQIATGGAGSETIVGQYLIALSTGTTIATGYRPIFPPIPVANATRIAVKTADSVGAKATLITLECIAQSNVVDDGITVGTVNLVNTLTTYTGNTVQTGDSFAIVNNATSGNVAMNADVEEIIATLGAAGAGLTAVPLPAITSNWLTAAGIAASALNGKGDWNIGKTGYTLTQSFPANFSALTITAGGAVTVGTNNDKTGYTLVAGPLDAAGTRSAVGLASANLDTQLAALDTDILTRLPTASYTAPDNASIATIKAQTNKLVFTVAGYLDVNTLKVNGVTIVGDGAATPFNV
jgi:hypothetical protein